MFPLGLNLRRVREADARPAKQAAADEDPPDADERPIGPACPHCGRSVTWYQSRLQQDNGSQIIVHSFQCTHCGTLVETEEPKKKALRVI
jgi:hypothetical protein